MAPPPSAGSARVRRDSTLSGDEDVFEDGKSSKPTTPKENEAPAKLVPAPPPKENIWQRRKEEQQQVSILFPPELCYCFSVQDGSRSKIIYSNINAMHFNWTHVGIYLKENIFPSMMGHSVLHVDWFLQQHMNRPCSHLSPRWPFFVRGIVYLFNALFKQLSDHFKRYEKPWQTENVSNFSLFRSKHQPQQQQTSPASKSSSTPESSSTQRQTTPQKPKEVQQSPPQPKLQVNLHYILLAKFVMLMMLRVLTGPGKPLKMRAQRGKHEILWFLFFFSFKKSCKLYETERKLEGLWYLTFYFLSRGWNNVTPSKLLIWAWKGRFHVAYI